MQTTGQKHVRLNALSGVRQFKLLLPMRWSIGLIGYTFRYSINLCLPPVFSMLECGGSSSPQHIYFFGSKLLIIRPLIAQSQICRARNSRPLLELEPFVHSKGFSGKSYIQGDKCERKNIILGKSIALTTRRLEPIQLIDGTFNICAEFQNLPANAIIIHFDQLRGFCGAGNKSRKRSSVWLVGNSQANTDCPGNSLVVPIFFCFQQPHECKINLLSNCQQLYRATLNLRVDVESARRR